MKKIIAILLVVLTVIGCFSLLSVNAANNKTATITIGEKNYTVPVGSKLTYSVDIKTLHKVVNGEFYLGYPQSILSIENNDAIDFPVVTKSGMYYNYTTNVTDQLVFNFSNQSAPYDFTKGGCLIKVVFDVVGTGNGEVGFINETEPSEEGQEIRESILSWVDDKNIIYDEMPNTTITETVVIVEPTIEESESSESSSSESNTSETNASTSESSETPSISEQSSSETQPTEPTGSSEESASSETPASSEDTGNTDPVAETSVFAKAVKNTIYVNEKTTVNVKVTNPVGENTFKSSNSKIATVNSKGVVTGKAEGKTSITVTNNKKSYSVNITVKKKNQSLKVKGSSKTLKYATVKQKNQTFKAITVKNAKGTVTYAKKKGTSKITINKKNGKITVKKGLKKGKYTVKVTVNAKGTSVYNKAKKDTTVKITIR